MRFRTVMQAFIIILFLFFIFMQGAYAQSPGWRYTSDTLKKDQDTIVEKLTGWPGALIKASLAIGFLTMTVFEVMKVNRRRSFNRYRVKYWLVQEYGRFKYELERQQGSPYQNPGPLFKNLVLPEEKKVIDSFILVCACGHGDAFFSLPIENLCGQIAVAVPVVLDFPASYTGLLPALLGKSSKEEDVRDDLMTVMNNQMTGNNAEPLYFDARNRLSTHIQRNIDALQISIALKWRNHVRMYCFIISFSLSFVGCLLFAREVHLFTSIMVVLLFTYLSAVLASLFRDAISILERFKSDIK
jgi:hypothetical protein